MLSPDHYYRGCARHRPRRAGRGGSTRSSSTSTTRCCRATRRRAGRDRARGPPVPRRSGLQGLPRLEQLARARVDGRRRARVRTGRQGGQAAAVRVPEGASKRRLHAGARAVVGDQMFTDILGGNCSGCTTVHGTAVVDEPTFRIPVPAAARAACSWPVETAAIGRVQERHGVRRDVSHASHRRHDELAGVIGWPLEPHALAGDAQRRVRGARPRLGLRAAGRVRRGRASAGCRGVRALPFVGFNVTMPYKAVMLELCDEVATAAELAGAVNTVHFVDGRLIGYNTDGRGLLESLAARGRVRSRGQARSSSSAPAARPARRSWRSSRRARPRVTLVSRDLARAEELVDARRLRTSSGRARGVRLRRRLRPLVRRAPTWSSTRPARHAADDPSPIPAEWLRGGQVVLDMVYGASADGADS